MNYKLLALVPMIAAGALIKNNKQLKVTNYNLEFKNLPEEFHNFKIAQVSDIHCDKVGISDLFFLEKLCKFSPDIIVITGDILDSYRNDMDIVYNILSQLSAVAPCYFVTGNHELRLPKEFEELKNMFERLNISYLHNEVRSIYKTNDKINLIGIEDYNYFKAKDKLNHRENFQDILSKLSDKNENNKLHRLLGTLLSEKLKVDEKLDILENEYDIPMEESIEEEVKTMCNLSEGIEERAMEAGRKAGIEEGRKTGLELGKKDLLKQQVQKKLLKGKDIDVIAEELEEEVAVIEKVIVELEQ